MSNAMCRIPVTATYRVINGEVVRVAADYRDISADAIARFLLEKCGVDAIFNPDGVGDHET